MIEDNSPPEAETLGNRKDPIDSPDLDSGENLDSAEEEDFTEDEFAIDPEELAAEPVKIPDGFSDLDLPAVNLFEEAELHPKLLETIKARGWEKPTPVQSMCLPYSILKHDLAGFAQTGTGKTGVFLMTLGHRFLSEKRPEEKPGSKKAVPFAVVLTPTRELAMQVDEESKKLCDALSIRSLAVFGGMDYEKQARKLQAGMDVIVATTGRFKDFYNKKLIDLSQCQLFVCDEVDRMFDMGFIEDVEFFLEKLPESCQKLLFSATTNEKVKELAFEYLDKPAYISANPEDLTPSAITQYAILCETKNKFKVLLGLLAEHKPKISVVFANTKLTAQWLHYKLSGNNISNDLITGDLPQRKRVALIKKIKKGEVKCLIATDVASRGLHISDITHVYNFDIPDEAANYVHRIGRTARAGAEGASYTLVCDEYGENFEAVQNLLKKDAPKSEWYNPDYLKIEDLAGNPFEDNFGAGYPQKSSEERTSDYRNKRRGGERDHKKVREDKPQGKDRPKKTFTHKGKAPKSQLPEKYSKTKSNLNKSPQKPSTSLWGLIKQLFATLFGGGKSKQVEPLPQARDHKEGGRRGGPQRRHGKGQGQRGKGQGRGDKQQHKQGGGPRKKSASGGGPNRQGGGPNRQGGGKRSGYSGNKPRSQQSDKQRHSGKPRHSNKSKGH